MYKQVGLPFTLMTVVKCLSLKWPNMHITELRYVYETNKRKVGWLIEGFNEGMVRQ